MSDNIEVQLAHLRGSMAGVIQNVDATGKEVDRLGVEVSTLTRQGNEWREHYGKKIDEMHKTLVGNGGAGILTKIAVQEGDIAHIKDVMGLSIKAMKEASIDWKTIAKYAVGLLQAILLIYLTIKLGG